MSVAYLQIFSLLVKDQLSPTCMLLTSTHKFSRGVT